MAGKRHTREVIAAKLAQADDMAARGETQQDISKALGVSVMTYHRWRKDRGDHQALKVSVESEERPLPLGLEYSRSGSLPELQVENDRLRRLVTDLLLEKMALQEQLHQQSDILRLRSRKP
ncbi:helix-turn-helix domain-containing protein [Rhodopseudomonas sp. B29]|uniref:helix-turn-helix domain-containing protein n=1 Tax=Rhodopseudomonas sp. B29 TaxID=95607 RepID=UPI0003B56122|nr:helix-turn-helix domain-containing protein [Rhodopseudomonas sp. B29]